MRNGEVTELGQLWDMSAIEHLFSAHCMSGTGDPGKKRLVSCFSRTHTYTTAEELPLDPGFLP